MVALAGVESWKMLKVEAELRLILLLLAVEVLENSTLELLEALILAFCASAGLMLSKNSKSELFVRSINAFPATALPKSIVLELLAWMEVCSVFDGASAVDPSKKRSRPPLFRSKVTGDVLVLNTPPLVPMRLIVPLSVTVKVYA